MPNPLAQPPPGSHVAISGRITITPQQARQVICLMRRLYRWRQRGKRGQVTYAGSRACPRRAGLVACSYVAPGGIRMADTKAWLVGSGQRGRLVLTSHTWEADSGDAWC